MEKKLVKNEVFKKDVSKTTWTYTHCIEANIKELNKKSEDRSVSAEELKNYIKSIVEKAANTPAKVDFINKIDNQPTKDRIVMLVYNAWLRGSGLGINKR